MMAYLNRSTLSGNRKNRSPPLRQHKSATMRIGPPRPGRPSRHRGPEITQPACADLRGARNSVRPPRGFPGSPTSASKPRTGSTEVSAVRMTRFSSTSKARCQSAIRVGERVSCLAIGQICPRMWCIYGGTFGLSACGPPRHVLSWKPSATVGSVEKNMSSSRRI
jgi:hypothetical protein